MKQRTRKAVFVRSLIPAFYPRWRGGGKGELNQRVDWDLLSQAPGIDSRHDSSTSRDHRPHF